MLVNHLRQSLFSSLATTGVENLLRAAVLLVRVVYDCSQLTDEFVRENIKSCSGLADARERLFEAQQLQTTEVRMPQACVGPVQQEQHCQSSLSPSMNEAQDPEVSSDICIAVAGHHAQGYQCTI
jgi:hypothetical protein